MADSLKDENKVLLFALMAANLALFYAAVQNNAIITGNWMSLARNLVGDALPAGLGLALIGIINAQFSPQAKSRIVFMRWNNSLPGCEAFTKHAKSDLRVDIASIESVYGVLPTEPKEQNALWYKMYKSVESEPSVTQVHRAFLLARDYACLALMMFVVLSLAGFLKIPSTKTSLIYSVVLLIQFLLACNAARNNGKRFVTTVLALIGSGRKGATSG